MQPKRTPKRPHRPTRAELDQAVAHLLRERYLNDRVVSHWETSIFELARVLREATEKAKGPTETMAWKYLLGFVERAEDQAMTMPRRGSDAPKFLDEYERQIRKHDDAKALAAIERATRKEGAD